MGACAEHGYYAGDCCDRCYPLRVCDECASLREEAEMFKERWELEQIRYEGISAANEALRARIAVLEKVVEVAARKPNKLGGHYAMWEHDLAIALDAAKEGKCAS